MDSPARLDQEGVRAFALTLPEAHEGAHQGGPDLRVRNKIFATLPTGTGRVHLKVAPAHLPMLVARAPDVFTSLWGGRAVGVRLDAIDPAELRQLVVDAYRLVAPKRLGDSVEATISL
jgi:hypothetical protein